MDRGPLRIKCYRECILRLVAPDSQCRTLSLCTPLCRRYKDLSTEEKEKDRAIVLAAVDYLVGSDCFSLIYKWACTHASVSFVVPLQGKFYNKTIWADRSGDELPSIDLSNLRVPDHAVDNKN